MARLGVGPAEYEGIGEGHDHERMFTARVKLASGFFGEGTGRTKKQAEQLAAEAAFTQLQGTPPTDA